MLGEGASRSQIAPPLRDARVRLSALQATPRIASVSLTAACRGRARSEAQIGCGQGVPEDLVQRYLADGRLKRVLEDWCQPHSGHHLYRQSRRQSSPAFALLVDGLRYRNYSSSGITPPMTMSRERMLSLKTRTPKSILICTIASRDLFVSFPDLSCRSRPPYDDLVR